MPYSVSNHDSNMYTMQIVTGDSADLYVNHVETTCNQLCSQNVKLDVQSYMYDVMTDVFINTLTADRVDTDWNVHVKMVIEISH